MRLGLVPERLGQIVRYYQAGIVNTVFGFAAYALLVRFGLDRFVAQILAHILGVGFNYLSYSLYVFRTARAAKLRFLLSYGANYLASLATLAFLSRLIASPYLAGLITVVLVALLNFFVLKRASSSCDAPAESRREMAPGSEVVVNAGRCAGSVMLPLSTWNGSNPPAHVS